MTTNLSKIALNYKVDQANAVVFVEKTFYKIDVIIFCCVLILAADVTAPNFWRFPFKSLCTYKQLTEFMVLQIEPVESQNPKASSSNLSQRV